MLYAICYMLYAIYYMLYAICYISNQCRLVVRQLESSIPQKISATSIFGVERDPVGRWLIRAGADLRANIIIRERLPLSPPNATLPLYCAQRSPLSQSSMLSSEKSSRGNFLFFPRQNLGNVAIYVSSTELMI